MCYTSGTTGRPKGALYSHRSTVLHSMMVAMGNTLGLSERDCVLPVVPMFHVNAWGLPFASVLVGRQADDARPPPRPRERARGPREEEVTFTAGVPTVFLAVLQALDADPGQLRPLEAQEHGHRRVRRAQGRHRGLREASRHRRRPRVGHDGDEPHRYGRQPADGRGGAARGREARVQGQAGLPRAVRGDKGRGDEGFVPWDGESMGELEVRGPWVARRVLQRARGGRQVHRRRLVHDRGHRHHRPSTGSSRSRTGPRTS